MYEKNEQIIKTCTENNIEINKLKDENYSQIVLLEFKDDLPCESKVMVVNTKLSSIDTTEYHPIFQMMVIFDSISDIISENSLVNIPIVFVADFDNINFSSLQSFLEMGLF
jgi:hypothetical protein